jgi:hypothetical protein
MRLERAEPWCLQTVIGSEGRRSERRRRPASGFARRPVWSMSALATVQRSQAPGRIDGVQETTTMLKPSSPGLRRAAPWPGGRPGCRSTPLQSRLLLSVHCLCSPSAWAYLSRLSRLSMAFSISKFLPTRYEGSGDTKAYVSQHPRVRTGKALVQGKRRADK